MADAIGGVVKRALDRQIAYGKDIINATDVYLTLESCVKAVKVFYISETEINGICEIIPAGLKTIKGTMSIHEVIYVHGNDEIQHRILSCFCNKKTCCCYDPETHKYQNFPHFDSTDNQALFSKLNELPILDTEMIDDLPILCIDNIDLEENVEAIENNSAAYRVDFLTNLSDIDSNPITCEIDAHKLIKSKENIPPNISLNLINPSLSTSKDPYPSTSKDPYPSTSKDP